MREDKKKKHYMIVFLSQHRLEKTSPTKLHTCMSMWHGPTQKIMCTYDLQYLGCWLSSAEVSPVLLLSPLLTLIKFWFKTNGKHISVIQSQHTKVIWIWILWLRQTDVSFLCVCPVIDHEFRHIIVKVALDHEMIAEWIRRLLWQCYDQIHCQ